MGDTTPEETEAQGTGIARLKANVIGPWGLAALVIGVTSPAIGLFAMWGPIEATAGPVVPLVFLGALAIILPTVLSYASLNRYAPSAGAPFRTGRSIVIACVALFALELAAAIWVRVFRRDRLSASAPAGFEEARDDLAPSFAMEAERGM